jgi:hypothetical protein
MMVVLLLGLPHSRLHQLLSVPYQQLAPFATSLQAVFPAEAFHVFRTVLQALAETADLSCSPP